MAKLETQSANGDAPALWVDRGTCRCFGDVKAIVDRTPIIDGHEHLHTEKDYLARKTPDIFKCLIVADVRFDLISSGMPRSDYDFVMETSNPLEERWRTLDRYLRHTRHIGYFKNARIATADLYGEPEINEDSCRRIHEKIKASWNAGLFKRVLADRAGIRLILGDTRLKDHSVLADLAGDMFLRIERFDNFVLAGREEILAIGEQQNMPVSSLKHFVDILGARFQQAVEHEFAVGAKSILAYKRTLYFEDVPQGQAEKVYERIVSGKNSLTDADRKCFQDYMLHRIVRLAIEHDVPMVFHTGMLNGNGNYISNANPALLTNLFLQYGGARFEMFHGAYPYMGELGVIAKYFPNVFINMNAMHSFGHSATLRHLEDWLHTVPINKISVAGADVESLEYVYAAARVARWFVAETLSRKVEQGYFPLSEAEFIARLLLHDNILNLYRLRENGEVWRRAVRNGAAASPGGGMG